MYGNVDKFNLRQFKDALPVHSQTGDPLWSHLGVEGGEHCFVMAVKQGVYIYIRSSVKSDGWSADCGDDSIRAYLVSDSYTPLGSKVTRWTTRIPGWQERFTKVLRELWAMGSKLELCRQCNTMHGVWKVKKDNANKGRWFTKCPNCGNDWKWLT